MSDVAGSGIRIRGHKRLAAKTEWKFWIRQTFAFPISRVSKNKIAGKIGGIKLIAPTLTAGGFINTEIRPAPVGAPTIQR